MILLQHKHQPLPWCSTAGEVRSFCNSFFAQGANLQSSRASGPVLQLAVLDAPGPAEAAVGGQRALQLDA